MLQRLLRASSVLTLAFALPAPVSGQAPTTAPAAAIAQVRDAVRRYDEALRRADTAEAGKFFAEEYIFVNARGERLTRADRLANLRTGRTAFESLAHVPTEDQIRPYGNIVVYTTLLTIGGRYSGRAEQGQYRALVVWIRRDGRWQQIASQMTAVAP